ncbi:hypothetical protein FUAX_39510 (plasmid) [Fulvitalea axinellae]|uniref:DinB family protein n=1 Tax=Fulvitalea axinellae TaxID=1182444 RepID=A0AAU9CH55_9BACT|nr:hypothetical protein FUAX_39510 [Fulvitalea axinellae]
MISKTELRDSIIHELDTVEWLYAKTPAKHYGFRPEQSMWSVGEVLRTLSFIGIYTAEALRDNDFKTKSHNRYYEMKKRAFEMNLETDFEKASIAQKEALFLFFENLKESQYEQEAWHPLLDKKPLNEALLEITLKFLTGYKTQLFTYLRMLGEPLVGADTWAGRDAPFYGYE